MNKTNIILIGVIIALIGIGTFAGLQYHKQKGEAQMQYNALTDTVSVTKNRLGQETAKIGALVTDYSAFKTFHFAVTDSLGRLLQKAVNGHTLAATVATQQLRVEATLPTTQTLRGSNGFSSPLLLSQGEGGTLRFDSCRPLYTLVFDSTDPYRKGMIIAGADSFRVDLRFPETLTFTTQESGWNLFKPTTYTSTYTNSNPYVDITGLRSYAVKCDCSKKSWISFALGGAAGTGLGFLFGRVK